jgi:acetylornithine deacetylase/succinyl-diaminopimelate desuccinylase-like protein
MNLADLDSCVRSLRDEMLEFTSDLVAIASENPPGNAYPECVRAIEARLRTLDLPCERDVPPHQGEA